MVFSFVAAEADPSIVFQQGLKVNEHRTAKTAIGLLDSKKNPAKNTLAPENLQFPKKAA